jgi:hypothetical protein
MFAGKRLEEYARDNVERKRVAEMGIVFIVGFRSGVRGEELLLVDLVDTRLASLQSLDHVVIPHFKLFVIGRLKGHGSEKRRWESQC